MKKSLKRHLRVFPKLRRRLSSVRWALLLITTAMFFLSAASTGCPTGSYILSLLPANLPIVSSSTVATTTSKLLPPLQSSAPGLPGITPKIKVGGSAVAATRPAK